MVHKNHIIAVCQRQCQSIFPAQRLIDSNLRSVEKFFLNLEIHFVVIYDKDSGPGRVKAVLKVTSLSYAAHIGYLEITDLLFGSDLLLQSDREG